MNVIVNSVSSFSLRHLVLRLLFLHLMVAALTPLPGLAQTPGMDRRTDRRDDRRGRMQDRDDKWQERRDDPIGVRGPQRREDRRETRGDRQNDRRERLY